MTPVGAFGAGVGSAMARGCGAGGRVGALVLTTGCLMGAGGGGGGATLGWGVSMNSLSISTGTTISIALRTNPLCKAQIARPWKTSTLLTITALRLKRGREKEGDKGAVLFIECGRKQSLPPCEGRAEGRSLKIYLRKIHQAEPTTRIRLPPSVPRSSMPCFPKWSWRAESLQPGGRHCTARPHRGRSFRTGHTGWPRRVRAVCRQTRSPHAHGGRCHGQKRGCIHRRSWRQAGWLAVEDR